MTRDETITACPECDSAAIRTRNTRSVHSTSDDHRRYDCKNCGHKFNEPQRRERRHTGSINGDTGAAALLNADPSDFDDVFGGAGQ